MDIMRDIRVEVYLFIRYFEFMLGLIRLLYFDMCPRLVLDRNVLSYNLLIILVFSSMRFNCLDILLSDGRI